ncbi:MAG TPA: YidC/Oxa1 family membrane protein insertase [Candidatus Portnoybacteria bacterium]|jgi:YidC/Oxa1 family membrane protein insertase|nr:YidC/Oxa1 family membrane protein insertase [Candidatus Portnoybacteria bacterium]MDD5752145.1 YidC/Oxa1 family membrane protein insertase [Candidatus Portnoybacteria bacterium]HOZ16459.1 YidC/Oxa1 family membrane protein insertase [Candidatus Portnoybacteria bacterium]HPH52109.1 YidC/Oxa1 family membrane protein insertase [Candidatus Portnoybacteria bacterium]HPJ80278.1 YidC/Oxa1 family membrane protein insertase [Candidatus Portnoybacteria bacterium]
MGDFFNKIFYEPIFNFLIFLYNNIPGHDLGVVIIILTVLVRIILFPLAQKSIKSQMELSRHKDKIKEIQTKFKNKEEQSRELMKFYKENKINPFSGCLPMIVQLPIIFALYRAFMNVLSSGNGLINPMFLGIMNLSQKSPVLAVLAGIGQFFASQMAMKRTITTPQLGTTEKAAETQKNMMRSMNYFFPIMTVFIALNLPSGLAFYWTISTILGLAQDYFLYKKYAPK